MSESVRRVGLPQELRRGGCRRLTHLHISASHLWKPPDVWWLTKKVRSKEYGSIFDHDHENGGSVKYNCKEHAFWRNTEPLGLYQFKLTLSEPQFPMWTNLMIIATSRVIMESKLNEILYTRYSKH